MTARPFRLCILPLVLGVESAGAAAWRRVWGDGTTAALLVAVVGWPRGVDRPPLCGGVDATGAGG